MVYSIDHLVLKRQRHVLFQLVQVMYLEILEDQPEVLVSGDSLGFVQRRQPKLLVRIKQSQLQGEEAWDRNVYFTLVDEGRRKSQTCWVVVTG